MMDTNLDSPLSDFSVELYRTVNFWDQVDKLMKHLFDTYPEDMKFIMKEAKEKRQAKFNDVGDSKGGDMLELGILPEPVGAFIRRYFPKERDRKNIMRSFFKTYSAFRTVEKI